MTESQEKLKKLFIAGCNLESELRNIQKISLTPDKTGRKEQLLMLNDWLNDALFKLVQTNEELFDMASKIENPDSIFSILEHWLDDVTKNNDEFVCQWLEVILNQSLTKTSYAQALILRALPREVCA